MSYFKYGFGFVVLFLSIAACSSTQQLKTKEDTPNTPLGQSLEKMFEQSAVFSGNFTGFMLYDPQSDEVIYAQNEAKYFTPASNTKLFTFYTGLCIIPDTLPALDYVIRGDSLIFWGTGDPSFLREDLDDGTVYHFLRNAPQELYYSDAHYQGTGLGPGWAWDDYRYAYSAEKSPFPMYGNLVEFQMKEISHTNLQTDSGRLSVFPPFFREHIQKITDAHTDGENPVLFRGFASNTFQYHPEADTTTYTVYKPYHYTPQLIVQMLSDTLHRPVTYIHKKLLDQTKKLYSVPADTVYKHMLQPSDNFIAEQLLLVASAVLGKTLDSDKVIDYMKEHYLAEMPDEPQWVDGSGLSRYNLFTPRSMIWLLQQIDQEFSSNEKLFELLAIGGEAGTIENWYAAHDGGPAYIFAKTGTLSNNHCLTGYLITESGHKLLFSFMNNHYVSATSEVKEAMDEVLWYIHEHY